jgi:pimeloyl-ACP methyl ester carboxylesterase
MKLVFIHGVGNTGMVWYYQTKYFTGSEAVTLPGHPEEQPATSVDEYTAWLHRYIQEKGYSQLILAGHSMGGAIAQTYALNYPEELKALILIATGARLRVNPKFLKLLENGVSEPAIWLKYIVEPPYSRVAPDVGEKVVNKLIEVGPAVQLNDFRCCDKFDIMEKVGHISLPTLVICGTEDDMTPVKFSQYLANRIIGSRLVIIEGGRHHCFLEKPGEVNKAIEDFSKDL